MGSHISLVQISRVLISRGLLLVVLHALIVLSLSLNEAFADPIRFKVGVTLPLSGALAAHGEEMKRGFDLALLEIDPDKVQAEVFYDDNRHEGKFAASSAHRLLDVEKVDVIVSLWDMADVVAPLADRKGKLHISIRWDPSVADRYENTLTMESTYKSYVGALFELARTLGASTVGLITQESIGWVLAPNYMQANIASSGLTIVADERFIPDSTDLGTIVLKALRNKPDLIILFSNPPYTEQLVRKLKEIAPDQKFTGYFETIQDPTGAEGIPFVAQFAVADWFVKKFHDRYGVAPKTRGAHAYDIARLLLKTAEQARTRPTLKALQATLKSEDFTGAVGMLKLSADKVIENECVWRVFEGGEVKSYGGQ